MGMNELQPYKRVGFYQPPNMSGTNHELSSQEGHKIIAVM